MTISVRTHQLSGHQFSILGIIAGVSVIPIGILGLLFLAEKLLH